MSDEKDPYAFNGSFGDFRSYDDPGTGKHIIARKGGPSSKQFKNDPNYARARERSNELGGRSTWSSLVKKSLSDIGHLTHVRCFNQIMAGGRQIQQKEPDGIHGYRIVSVKNNPEALAMIDFNESHPFRNVIRFANETILFPDKQTVTLHIPEFITSRDVRWGLKFYAVRLSMVIAQVSDVVWNPVLKVYEPVVPDLDILSKCVVSDWMVRNSTPNDVRLEASFEEPAFSSPGSSVIVAMGVEVSLNTIMGQPYAVPRDGSMAIVGYFAE
jgi:hypothetical protein